MSKRKPDLCKRCSSRVVAGGWCEDQTCPHSDWPQSLDMADDFNADGELNDPDNGKLKRIRMNDED